jgi:hypothetical protein
MSNADAVNQDSNIQPARRGQGVAIAVDATARPYDITGINWNSVKYNADSQNSWLYLDLQNDGTSTIYYYFDTVTSSDMAEGTIQAAGATLAQVNAVPKAIPTGVTVPVRIKRDVDKWLVLKSSATSTLRIFPSSDSTVRTY